MRLLGQKFCVETDNTILLLDHLTVAGAGRGDGSSNSPSWTNAARGCRLTLASNDDGTSTLTYNPRNSGPKMTPRQLMLVKGVWMPARPEANHAEELATTLREACFECIKAGATIGQFIKRGVKPAPWVVDMFRRATPAVKLTNELFDGWADQLMVDGKVTYQPGGGHTPAGYRLVREPAEVGR